MADEPQGPNPNLAGQVADAPWSQGTTEAAPAVGQEGQAKAPDSQDPGQASSTPATEEPSFFDPTSLAPELLPAYKRMQAAFTVKTQDIARNKQKIEAYDNFMRDPVGEMQRLAAQYGLNLSRAQAAQEIQRQDASSQEWTPQTWEEVIAKAEERAEQRVLQRLAPYLGQMQTMQAQSVEQQLNTIDKDWKQYEPKMRELLQKHPTLANDVGDLYRMAVPPELLEAKAIQQALKKFDEKAQHLNVSQASNAPRGKPAPAKVSSFDEAVAAAKQQIASGEA